jgi:hypothetical protein
MQHRKKKLYSVFPNGLMNDITSKNGIKKVKNGQRYLGIDNWHFF